MSIIICNADLKSLFKFEEGMKAFGMARVRQIAGWTLNQVGNKMRTQVIRSLVEQSGIHYGVVAGEMTTEAASAWNLRYALTGSGKYFGVGYFHATQLRAGVKAAPWNRRLLFRGTFMRHGKVLARTSPARYPLKELFGPSVPREMERDAIPQDFIEAAENELPAAIDKKLNQMLPL